MPSVVDLSVADPKDKQLFVSQGREGGQPFLCLKIRQRKNFSTKKRSFGQFLIWIRIQDSDTNDPELTSGRIRIWNLIRNFYFGSATLVDLLYPDHFFHYQNSKIIWQKIKPRIYRQQQNRHPKRTAHFSDTVQMLTFFSFCMLN